MKIGMPLVILLLRCAGIFYTGNALTPAGKDSAKTYLALGDSYTIGESVEANDNYPNQLVAELKALGIKINEPEIRAVTGWTTNDLINSLRASPPLLKKYDLVTLLIGVNNQYRGRGIEEYTAQFNSLLNTAIAFAGDKNKVLIISIPDYSITPFANSSSPEERKRISKQIDKFNEAQKDIAEKAGVKFINITAISRKGKRHSDLQAFDGLHPSAKQYKKWVSLLKKPAFTILQQ